MKLSSVVAAALFAAAPAFASAQGFVVDFEKQWDAYGANGSAVNGYYNGGAASDGSSGANLGIEFIGMNGLSNDADFTYYANAPTLLGVAFTDSMAIMNIAAGLNGALSFAYSTPVAIADAVLAYSGLNGTGTLLGSFSLGTSGGTTGEFYNYDGWRNGTLSFAGTAQSFVFSGTTLAAFDNISAVPETSTALMMLAGAGLLAAARRRKAG